ncbi:hypothetical protein BDB00DRAFT_319203 [Zychaea mexicana]|uniref:uncharacterized protein n=1 Tax=Zychaea mexicana TaxID=64656 RepID=UPI0022FE4EBB|nr:uncharacterized protein BDB00DRAFT_319203 [Zychaea mexicana]KAI9494284.1 hypothetical protein BDB00DRAFT_319203 [Zychaea mexicana]
MDQFTDTAQLLNFSLADLGFGSETAGLEYGIIGNMLQNPLTDLQTAATTTATSSTATATTINGHSMPTTSTPTLTTTTTTTTTSGTNHVASAVAAAAAAAGQQQQQQQTFPYAPAQFSTLLPMTSSPSPTTTTTATNNHSNNHNVGVAAANGSNSMTPPSENKASPGPPTIMKRDSVSSAGSQPTTGAAGGSSSNNNNIKRKHSNHDKTPEAVYNNVRRPFNYAEGFHYLIQYVREKMGREDLMRISRALALFRPSFLALIMNLTEEDLVFMEKCLQRTLLEYEKLISFSGTPTVVWRRTGEICLVGKEFSLLTQWQRDLLLHKKTYIYELMDNGSAVEYWEKFATHAFDNTDKACTFSCILRTPTHKAVPCTFCFTIKRDIFDLPSVIVGNVSFSLLRPY